MHKRESRHPWRHSGFGNSESRAGNLPWKKLPSRIDITDNDCLFISALISPNNKIIFKCKEHNYDYMSLFQDPKVSPGAISCNYMSDTKNEEQTSFTGLSLYEKESLNHFINVGRQLLDLETSHQYT